MPSFTFLVDIPVEVCVEVEAETVEAAEALLTETCLTERGGRGEDTCLTVESTHSDVCIGSVDWGLYGLADGNVLLDEHA